MDQDLEMRSHASGPSAGDGMAMSPKEISLPTARFMFAFPVVLLVLVSIPALAQSQSPDEMVCEVRVGVNLTADSALIAAPASLSDTPPPQKGKVIDKKVIDMHVIDKKFIAVMGVLGGAESLRFTTHKLVLDHELAAGAPWVTSVPANQHLVAKYAVLYAVELLVAYELKKPHTWIPGDKFVRKFWWVYPAAMAPLHIKNGVGSIRTQAPSGCPPEECEGQ